jgi:hypothetical protein
MTSLGQRALRHPSFAIGLVLTTLLVAVAALSLVWTPHSPYEIDMALRLRAPGHDDYAFHTTLAYVKRALPTAALPVWRATMAEWTARLQDEIPQMDLAPPAFCSFEDMCAFPPIRPLA